MKTPFAYLAAFAAASLGLAPLSAAQFGDHFRVNRDGIGGGIAEAGDIDADGDEDVVIADGLGRLAWRSNLGTGTFAAPRQIINAQFVFDFTLADLDGDSDLDLVAIVRETGPVNVLQWFEFTAQGDFGPGVTFGASVDGANVEAADMDGDGDLDVLSHDRGAIEIIYFENLGSGVISSVRTVIASRNAISVKAADFDGDGDQDVIAGTLQDFPYGFDIYENEGNGNWTRTFATNIFSWGRYVEFEVGDLDGDGDLDVVGASLANRYDWWEQIAPLTFRNRQQFHTGWGRSLDIGDVDLDGDLDILTFGTDLDIQENLGGGAFQTYQVEDVPVGSGRARFADLDGNGNLDVLWSSRSSVPDARWTPSLGLGAFAPSLPLTATGVPMPGRVATGDFNADGLLDVATISDEDKRVSVLMNLGGGEFSAAVTFDTALGQQGESPLHVLATDVDGDGDLDVAGFAGGGVWWKNQGQSSGQFGPPRQIGSGGASNYGFLMRDINADGHLDLVQTSSNIAYVFVLYGQGGGLFAPFVDLITTIQGIAPGLDAADFDGDGDLDIAMAFRGSGDVQVMETLPGDAFGPPVDAFSSSTKIIGAHTLIAADLDQDGFTDLIGSGTSRTRWARGLGDGTFATDVPVGGLSASQGTIHSMQVTDVDGDSRLDVVLAAGDAGSIPDSVTWARNLGDGTWTAGGSFLTGTQGLIGLHAADFGGDLDNDLFLASRTDDRITLFQNIDGVGAGYCAPAATNSAGRSASILGSGSTLIADDDLTLQAFDLPLNKVGFFITSRQQGFLAQPAGSQGNLCLAGFVGRYQQQVMSSSTTGTISVSIQPSSMHQPNGNVSAVSGETWSFQCWHRDTAAGAASSNFTSGFAVRFR